MKRDMELVRKILLALEAHPQGSAPSKVEIEGYTEEQIKYHAFIMGEAGLVKVVNATRIGGPGPEALLSHLTWSGHEFLDAAKAPSRWERFKKYAAEQAGAVPFEVAKALLTQWALKDAGL